jgi:hypothetical protein
MKSSVLWPKEAAEKLALASVLLKGTDLEPILSEAEWMP